MEITFCELKAKEVVNIVDGRRLGNIIDMVFCRNTGKVLGLIVPGCKKGFNIFKVENDLFIPYKNICKIGEDVILVQLFTQKGENQAPERVMVIPVCLMVIISH